MPSKTRNSGRGAAARILAVLLAGLLALLAAAFSSPTLGSSPAAPPSSTLIAIAEPYLLVANPDSGTLSIIDRPRLALLAEVPVGMDPRGVAVGPDGDLAYVVNQGSDTISVVDLAARQAIAEKTVGDRPVSVVLAPNGRFLAVAELGNDAIRFLDPVTLSTLSLAGVADRPYGLSFTPDGRFLLISHLLSGRVTRLPALPYAAWLPLTGGGGTGAGAPFSSLTLDTWPHIAPAPAVLVNGAGTRAYLPQTMANGAGLNIQFDTTVFPKVSVLNLTAWRHATAEHISLPDTDRPVGLPWAAALAQRDGQLWVVNAASNDVSIIDLSTPELPRGAGHVTVGANPRGIVFAPDESAAYVANTLDGTVSVIDTETQQVTAVLPTTTLPLPPLLLRGKQLFYSSATPAVAQARWISCATCHIEGEHDGRTWQLQYIAGPAPPGATVPRNTTSLLGMIETYPLRWSAEWDESADSEFSIRFEQFGTGLIAGEMYPTDGLPNQGRSYDLDCLAAYIDSLAVPPGGRPLTAAAARGQAIFNDPRTECLSCHPPPLYTDLQVHDVGTAVGPDEHFGPLIDTPTLRFLHDSAPYLHDGAALTLRDVLTTANAENRHGVTSQLSAAELDDLVAFLRALPLEK